MTTDQRTRAFLKEVRRQGRIARQVPEAALPDIIAQLKKALEEIRAILAGQPSEWQQFHLSQVKAGVTGALTELQQALDGTLSREATRAWHAGIDMIDRPLAAGGVVLSAGGLSIRQLSATQVFLTDKIAEITSEARRKINSRLSMVLIGAATPGDVINDIARILASTRNRAKTIAYTELGRVYEAALHERRVQVKERLPGLKKQWRRSGKIHSRHTHDRADGQIQPVDEPFIIAGEALMYPRDPAASAKNTINCGCSSVPIMDSWEVRNPRRSPVSEAEMRADPRKVFLATGTGGGTGGGG